MDNRWHGWRSRGAQEHSPNEWIELSHPLSAALARIPFFPPARFERIMSMPKDPLNATEIQMVCHFGTHVDAPCHFIPEGPAFHQIPLDRLQGPGVVWHIDAEPYGLIDAATLERQRPAPRPDDIVLLDTGWSAHIGSERYGENPSLTADASAWLVAQRIKLLAVDFVTPDLAVPRRPAGFDWPVHHALLGNGVLIAENLTNLGALAGHRVEAMFLALNIEGADGAPARVIARRVGDD
jgi:kynurenine formamidase